MRKFFSYSLVLFLFSYSVFAQTNVQEIDTDTVKKNDTIIPFKIKSWKLNAIHFNREYVDIDTAATEIHNYNPTTKYATTAASLGNIGQAAYSNAYFENTVNADQNIFLQAYNLYYHDIENPLYYNTTHPFSWISYVQGQDDLKNIQVFHAQNIKKDFNFGGKLNYWESQGPYVYQKTNANNIHTFFNYDGLRYNISTAYSFSFINAQDMEGLVNDSLISPTRGYAEDEIPVRSSGSNDGRIANEDVVSQMRRNTIFVRQEWNLGRAQIITDSAQVGYKPFKRSIGHILKYEKSERLYKDNMLDVSNFDTCYYDTTASNDFAKQWLFNNEVFLKTAYSYGNNRNIALQADFGIKYTRHEYNDVFWQHPYTARFNKYVAAHLFGDVIKNMQTGFYGKITYDGREAGDMQINGYISKDILILNDSIRIYAHADQSNTTAHYFYDHYASNNYAWNNNFDKEIRTKLTASIYSLRNKFSIEGNAIRIGNYIYCNASGLPNQTTTGITVAALKLQKLTHVWKIYMNNTIIVQNSSDETIIPLPQYVTKNSLYFRSMVFNKKLDFIMGADLWFTPEYYAPSYNYATGLFQLQTEKKIGNYPFIDLFMNIKFKRMRVFAKYSHVNYHFMDGEYFTIAHYPQNRNSFTFGLNWHFYN